MVLQKRARVFLTRCFRRIEQHLHVSGHSIIYLFFDSELKGKKAADAFKDKILELLNIWEKWNALESNYLGGLQISFLNKKRKSDYESGNEIPQNIKAELENYEDELLDIFSKSEEELKQNARKLGISGKGEPSVVIAKLVSLKVNLLIEENQKVMQFYYLFIA